MENLGLTSAWHFAILRLARDGTAPRDSRHASTRHHAALFPRAPAMLFPIGSTGTAEGLSLSAFE